MPNIAPRISEQTKEYLQTNFKTLNAGAEFVLEAWPQLYRRTLLDMKSIFSRGELSLLIDVYNGTALTPGFLGQVLHAQVEDGINLDGLDKKWGIDKSNILSKILALSSFDAACLELWASAFWYRSVDFDYPETSKRFDEYIDQLT